MSRPWRSATPDETGVVLPWVNWAARSFGFLWVGLVAFVFYPPSGGSALAVQAVAYSAAGLGVAAWIVLEGVRRAAPHRGRFLPAVLGLVAAAAGAAAAAALGSGSVGGLALVIYGFFAAMAAGSETSAAAALGVAAAGMLATEVTALAFSSGVGTLVGLPVVIASGALIGRQRGAYRIQAEQAAALLVQREQLQSEQRRADLLDERTRIAREIHDVLAHSLGALSIQIQAARSVLTDRGDIDRASDLLAAAQRMAAEGLTETRRAVHALRADTLPLEQELARATDTYAQRYAVGARFSAGGAPRAVPPDATIAMLRIAQEALVNAAKHGAGQAVTVRLDYRDCDVRLAVRNNLVPAGAGDDGRGPDGAPAVQTANAGYGLTGMRERLRILNGTLEAGRHDGEWVVTAQLPLPGPESMAP